MGMAQKKVRESKRKIHLKGEIRKTCHRFMEAWGNVCP
jgi:hypothetical protein